MSYSIEMFANMFHSEQRHQGYVEALRRSIKPGDVVIDIGTGIGVYAIEAARLGAGKVYAIETSPLIRLGPRLAADNGFGPDRIEFLEMMSTSFTPPELADVVFADLRGRTPFYSANIQSLHDAARRLLKPGGVLIPQVDTVWASFVTAPESVAGLWDKWDANPFGFNLRAARDVQFSAIHSAAVRGSDLLTAPEHVATIRYGHDASTEVNHVWRSTVVRDGLAAGVSVWFDAQLVAGVSIGNGPEGPTTVYGGGFLGFSDRVSVRAGQAVELRVRARRGSDGDYVWSWGVDVFDPQQPGGSDELVVTERRRGTNLEPVPAVPKSLALYRPDRTVEVTEEMRLRHRALSLMVSGQPIGEVSKMLLAEFPTAMIDPTRARNYVVDLASRFESLGPLQ